MKLQEFFSATRNVKVFPLSLGETDSDGYRQPTPKVHCMDGTTLSVQVGSGLYCIPRDNNGPYTHVEVGFPSRGFTQLTEYIDGTDDADPCESVYGYVPIEIVEEIIEECGGMCVEITLLKVEKHG
jgi:hypothetical protein